jgi:hypothetical protein
MNTNLLLEAIIAAASVMGLSSSPAGLWVARKAAGKAAGEAKDVIEDPVGKEARLPTRSWPTREAWWAGCGSGFEAKEAS